jgi:uncharacterized protein YmfQ (DUF2313 family)
MPGREEYRAQLEALTPQGAAWPKDGDGVLGAVLDALAAEFERVDAAAAGLMAEIDPREASDLLADWERAYGLPDGCVTADPTPGGRRLALHQKVASLGGQSAAYFVGLSALLGHEAEVETFRPSRVPFSLARPVADVAWAFAWRLVVWGPAEMGDPTPLYGSADLECVVQKSKPGHTVLSIDWEPDPEPLFHFDFLNPPD